MECEEPTTEFDTLEQKMEKFKIQDDNGKKANPISFMDITCAAYKIRNHIRRTPITKCYIQDLEQLQVYLKKEFMQITGSFKERGACYALLSLSEVKREKGTICASLGNHSQALSYHGDKQSVPVTVVMPTIAPIMKIQACKRYGANVIVHGSDMSEAKTYAMQYAKEHDLEYINGYDDPEIIAGQGTIALEILEDIPDIEVIVVPIGGGGLIAGIALAAKTINPNIIIVGVEAENCPSFTEALKHGKPTTVNNYNSIADGLAVPKVGDNAFAIAKSLVNHVVTVKEGWIALTILRLVEREKCVVEGAGAAGLAALLFGQLDDYKNKKLAIVLCGGNIDSTVLSRCIERGLAVDGRLLKFCTTVSDRPGGISDMCKLLAQLGASVKDIIHERAWLSHDVFSVRVTIVCETKDVSHQEEVKAIVKEKYIDVIFS